MPRNGVNFSTPPLHPPPPPATPRGLGSRTELQGPPWPCLFPALGGCCPRLPWGHLAPLPNGATGVPAANAPPGPDPAVLRPALGRLRTCTTLPHCDGQWTVGILPFNCHTARGQWAVEPLLHTASLPWGSGQWHSCGTLAVRATLPEGSEQCNSCGTLPHCLGAVGSRDSCSDCHSAGE